MVDVVFVKVLQVVRTNVSLATKSQRRATGIIVKILAYGYA